MSKAELSKTYEPHQVERRWYQRWESAGMFGLPSQSERPGGSTYCITIPPPNVTGSLHMGHALQHSIHDAVARWRRLLGDRVLVVPGTDHAAISTNMKVEQALAEEGVSRHDIGRDAFLARCWEWTRLYGGQIIDQLKALGCSYDWSRLRFTLDEDYTRAVLEAFVRFHRRGWIYRGHRVVNWCPTCASTVSDLEVEHHDQQGHLWYVRYPLIGEEGGIVVATTRPETMLGDTAVAVNSADARYAGLCGKQVMLPLMDRPLPIICDDLLVDPEFGTGAVKVTPAHDPNDFEASQRNKLPAIIVIGTDARMTEAAGPYAGLDRYEARERIIEDLKARGLLVKTEDYVYSVGRHDRCGTVLEPLLSEQWFLRMSELARAARRVLEGERPAITYRPDRFRQYTLSWLDELRDWNISRQIWWGHRIPVYSCTSCGRRLVQVDPPDRCDECGGPVEQDPDTLDTWFSSALWPFAVLGWPDEQELQASREAGAYPTALMITARDILYLWIVRMVMTSLEFTGEIPFRQVLVHPTVLDVEGRRMSKSLGTGVDPLELISRYGADATRFSLLYQCATDQDIRFGEERTEMARNFCNKIWNASRFVLMNLGDGFVPAEDAAARALATGSLAQRWILSRCYAMQTGLEAAMSQFAMAEASRVLYTFFWSEFCDWFVEMCKPALRRGGEEAEAARQTLCLVLRRSLCALHPFMPFITEEIWSQLPGGGGLLIEARWPAPDPSWKSADAERDMEVVTQVVAAARRLRAEQGVPPGQRVEIAVATDSAAVESLLRDNQEALLLLAGGSDLTVERDMRSHPAMAAVVQAGGRAVAVSISRRASRGELEQQKARLEREREALRQEESRLSRKLQSAEFRSRAPQDVVAKTEGRLQEARGRLQAVEMQLAELVDALAQAAD